MNNSPINFNDPSGHLINVPDPDYWPELPPVDTVNLSSNDFTNKTQYNLIPGDNNLCGHLSFQMIYETITSTNKSVTSFAEWGYDNGIPFNGGTTAKQLSILCQNFLPKWSLTAMSWKGYEYLTNGDVKAPFDGDSYESFMEEALNSHQYVIVAVMQDRRAGGTHRLVNRGDPKAVCQCLCTF